MTASTLRPAHAQLRMVDPERSVLQSDLVEALNQRRVGTLLLSAHALDESPPTPWIALEAAGGGTFHLAPLLADGVVPSLTDHAGRLDAAAAAAALGAIETVVAAIELVVARSLRPIAVAAGPAGESVIVQVEAHDGAARVHRLLLAAAVGSSLGAPDALPLDPASIVGIAPAWTARIAGPAIPTQSLARIGTGDLLLIGTGGLFVRFVPPGREVTLAARLDVQGGTMLVEQELEPADDVAPVSTESPGDRAMLQVPTSIEFDAGGLTLDRLAALGVGSVVRVPGAAGAVLPVRLRAGGKAVASGELVAVGDGYGVLITALIPHGAGEG